ncbi:hypothetical protein M0R45_031218 [Rubus argutus]|uniref:Pentatricopeptide repeat-containing protein n=1 Tax=Rubus argutus TaxID=59490 RepID=A0AAW1WDL9_RUBAR
MMLQTNNAISHSQLLASLVESAVSTRSSLLGRAAHAQIIRTLDAPHPSFLSNHLVNMYSKLDLPNSAQLVLQLSPSRSVVTWTALIAGFVHNGHFASAISNFANMRRDSIHPNDFTFPCVSRPLVCFVCRAFDMYCKTGLETRLGNCLMKCLTETLRLGTPTCRMRCSTAAANAVYKFIEFLRPVGSLILFCAFLNACSDTSALELGRQLHGFVMRCGFGKDVSVLNGLVDFYGKCQDIGSSKMVFDRIGLAWLEQGRSVHALAVKACVDGNVFVGSALVDMYGKCGSIEDAECAFDELPSRNLITWNAMVGGYTHQGHASMALALFEEMSARSHEVKPNYVTLVCVLSACSREGDVQKGMQIFDSMKARYGVEPGAEHYACIVDLLGRSGMVERAYEFITKMPIRPTISIWGALLGACKMYRKPELGKIAADKLFELDPKDSGNRVVLSNLFAAAGRWEEATLVRKEMKDVGIKKGAGYSWIAVKNAVHIPCKGHLP